MDKIQEIMGLVDAYAEACFDQALNRRRQDDAPEDSRKVVESALRELLDRKDLHAEIMNLSVDKACIDELGINELLAYKRGHKDARHAAAEIVAAIGA